MKTLRYHTRRRSQLETWIAQYNDDEMKEVFSAEERATLARGEVLIARPDAAGHQAQVVDLEAFFLANQTAIAAA